jgi:Uma2 family endonuclease
MRTCTPTASNAETRIVIPNISWEIFESLGASDCAGTRFAYDKGVLEIMSPSVEHEWCHCALSQMIQVITEELNVPRLSAGSTTLKLPLKQRGLEPDACFYLANEAKVRGKSDLDLAIDPPPDLAIEVDISRSSLNKLDIYADIGVPELWLYDGETICVYELQTREGYAKRDRSVAFPFLDLREVERFIAQFDEAANETAWIRSFRAWVRDSYGHLAR